MPYGEPTCFERSALFYNIGAKELAYSQLCSRNRFLHSGVKAIMHDLRLGRYVVKRYEVRFALLVGFSLLALWLLAAHLFRPDRVFLLLISPIVREPTREQMSRLPNNGCPSDRCHKERRIQRSMAPDRWRQLLVDLRYAKRPSRPSIDPIFLVIFA